MVIKKARKTRAALPVLALVATAHALPAIGEGELMQGFPPPKDEVVTLENFMAPPFNRWAFQHIRELLPTRDVYRGEGAVRPLEKKLQPLDDLEFELYGGRIIDLPTLKKGEAEHGDAFHYVTPNTEVLGWLNSRVTGQGPAEMLSDRIWQRLGVERDGYFWLGTEGAAMAGGGLNVTARDAARFGQMILQKGRYNGEQILPEAVAERVLRAGNHAVFNKFYQDPWYEHIAYAYHDQWWTFNNSHKAVSAIGVHGQFIYLDPVAEMVVIKQSSHQDAEGESNEVHGPQILHQIAEHLIGTDR